jgi:hypothetical protein
MAPNSNGAPCTNRDAPPNGFRQLPTAEHKPRPGAEQAKIGNAVEVPDRPRGDAVFLANLRREVAHRAALNGEDVPADLETEMRADVLCGQAKRLRLAYRRGAAATGGVQ